MLETQALPSTISMFPGITERVYYQNPETGEFWFHATSVCNTLGFSNVTSALALHCDEDEKFQEIWNGKATWFVSEAGCYGLAMGAKNEVAKKFKRWLKHDVLKKLRASGGYISPDATSTQLEALTFESLHQLALTNFQEFRGICRTVFEFECSYQRMMENKTSTDKRVTEADIVGLFYFSR